MDLNIMLFLNKYMYFHMKRVMNHVKGDSLEVRKLICSRNSRVISTVGPMVKNPASTLIVEPEEQSSNHQYFGGNILAVTM